MNVFVCGRKDGQVKHVIALEEEKAVAIAKAEKYLDGRGYEVQTFAGADLVDVVESNKGFFEGAAAERG